ncbi:MAG: ABC transporter permease, partial [Silicimonas sp.]|nr:ABC transporter permease [Silicimonas sp.]
MSDATADKGAVLAADGTPLKRSLNRALRREKMRAFLLVVPLLVFIMVTFVAPIADMLFRSVENNIVGDTIPRTVQTLKTWDAEASDLPDEETFLAFYTDLVFA